MTEEELSGPCFAIGVLLGFPVIGWLEWDFWKREVLKWWHRDREEGQSETDDGEIW